MNIFNLFSSKSTSSKSMLQEETCNIDNTLESEFYLKIKDLITKAKKLSSPTENTIYSITDTLELNKIKEMPGVTFNFQGKGNSVFLYKNNYRNVKIQVGNNVNIVILKSKHHIHNTDIDALFNNGGGVFIGNDFSTYGMKITSREGKNVYIGDDNMFSYGIFIWNTDAHTILKDGKIINYGEDVVLGNHVWIGHGVEILKGANIPDNSIVGSRALVTNKFSEPGSVIAGIPAKVLHTGVTWDRRNIQRFIAETKYQE